MHPFYFNIPIANHSSLTSYSRTLVRGVLQEKNLKNLTKDDLWRNKVFLSTRSENRL